MRAVVLGVAIAAAVALIAGPGPAGAYSVYVSNEKGNSITVLDSATLEVKETIPVGQRPRGIKLTKDDKYLLICASDDDTVQMLDVASREIVGDLPSGPDPELLNIHPSGSPVYVANEDDNLLTAIDLADKKVVAEVEVEGVDLIVTLELTSPVRLVVEVEGSAELIRLRVGLQVVITTLLEGIYRGIRVILVCVRMVETAVLEATQHR